MDTLVWTFLEVTTNMLNGLLLPLSRIMMGRQNQQQLLGGLSSRGSNLGLGQEIADLLGVKESDNKNKDDPLEKKQFVITSINELRIGAKANIIDGIQGRHAGNKLRKKARRRRVNACWKDFLNTIDDEGKRDEVAELLENFTKKEIDREERLKKSMASWRKDIASKDPITSKMDKDSTNAAPFYMRLLSSFSRSESPEKATEKLLTEQLKNEEELMRKLKHMGIDVSSNFNSLLSGSVSAMDLVANKPENDDASSSPSSDDTTTTTTTTKQIYVLDFKGDTGPSQVNTMKEEITAILCLPNKPDEVIVRLYSPGGSSFGYGLAATELKRIKLKGITLTVSVDEIAASGGYMMAAVADCVVASPWSIIGSVGVLTGIPNAADRLEREGLKFYKLTAGKHKSNIDPFTRPTKEGLEQTQSDLERVHELFSRHVRETRGDKLKKPIEDIANGDIWQGYDALDVGLIDELMTSEELIEKRLSDGADMWHLKKNKKTVSTLEKLMGGGGDDDQGIMSLLGNSSAVSSSNHHLLTSQLEMNRHIPELK